MYCSEILLAFFCFKSHNQCNTIYNCQEPWIFSEYVFVCQNLPWKSDWLRLQTLSAISSVLYEGYPTFWNLEISQHKLSASFFSEDHVMLTGRPRSSMDFDDVAF